MHAARLLPPSVAAALSLALLAQPARAVDLTGQVSAWEGCNQLVTLDACSIVMAVKLDGNGYDDWIFHLSARAGGADVGFVPSDFPPARYVVRGSAFTRPESPTDVTWIVVQQGARRVAFDSGSHAGPVTLGRCRAHRGRLVGDREGVPGLPDVRAVARGGPNGIALTFTPLLDLDDTDRGGCTAGGAEADPATGRGIVRGYNVFRVMAGATPPSVAEMLAGWQYFIDLDTFVFDAPSGPADDLNPWDLAGWVNPDGVPYSGDETVVFADQERNPDGSARRSGTGPIPFVEYWYGLQAVVRGNLSDFADVSLAGRAPADYRVDSDGDGTLDGVDVDGDGVLEFYSPQAALGLPGLGLAPVGTLRPGSSCVGSGDGGAGEGPEWIGGAFGGPASTDPLAASEAPDVRAELDGRDVRITVVPGLLPGRVLGLAVDRVTPAERVRVTDGLLPFAGAEDAVQVVLDRGAARLARRPDNLAYEVVAIRADGSAPEVFGPYPVAAPGGEGRDATEVRRRARMPGNR